MSLESVRAFFAAKAPDIAVIESDLSSATVARAAEAFGVEPARIARTLSLAADEFLRMAGFGRFAADNERIRLPRRFRRQHGKAGAVADPA